jgi:hypothetical protein
MKALEEHPLDIEVEADGEALIESILSGRPLDPATADRIRERSLAITDRLRREHGLVDIAVPAVRELRDGP